MVSFTKVEQKITNNLRTDSIAKGSKALVLLSGGMDSAVALYLVSKNFNLDISVVDYQHQGRSKLEAIAVDNICQHLELRRYSIEYPSVKITPKTKDNGIIHLAETNSLYYVITSNLAVKIGAKYVIGGTIKSDWYGRNTPQASPVHFNVLNKLSRREYGENAPLIVTPLSYLDKRQVAVLGHILGVPFDMTRSCPKEGVNPCNKCSYCLKRNDALSYLNELLRAQI
jgi:7-cyano-7-deazaguanine synthase